MNITINSSLKLQTEIPACLKADLTEAGSQETLLAISASDDRGAFSMLDYSAEPVKLVEVVHSKPRSVRGNHIHQHCTEKMTVTAGEIELYLLCQCDKKHFIKRRLKAGDTIIIHRGTAHALVSVGESELVVAYSDGDPRADRERIELIS